MEVTVEREDVWAVRIEDSPGALAEKLTILAEAGADLDFIIARRATDQPGTGVAFVTPLRGDREVDAATEAGFSVSKSLHSLCVEGRNQPGVAAQVTRKLAAAKINLRGFSAGAIGTQCVIHLAFDKVEDSDKAMKLLQQGI